MYKYLSLWRVVESNHLSRYSPGPNTIQWLGLLTISSQTGEWKLNLLNVEGFGIEPSNNNQ